MKELTPIQMLDKVLDWFALEPDQLFEDESNENVLEPEVFMNIVRHFPELDKAKYFLTNIAPILKKLHKDKYIEIKEITTPPNETKHPLYSVTFDGKFFSKKGGYQKQSDIENKGIFIEKVLGYTVAISGGVVAVFYLLETIRHYILPLFACQSSCGQ